MNYKRAADISGKFKDPLLVFSSIADRIGLITKQISRQTFRIAVKRAHPKPRTLRFGRASQSVNACDRRSWNFAMIHAEFPFRSRDIGREFSGIWRQRRKKSFSRFKASIMSASAPA
jgi:hypothetical protein